ncbi:MAG: hypothetical protein FJ253_01250 [Phycisphaerae bacterium]|nr:hypothetical protein [Phycisphaerae bacterium]
MPSSRVRQRFAPDEAMAVLRRMRIGEIEHVVEFPRGSSRSPKILVTARSGRWLVKRRAPANSQPERVRFCQNFQRLLDRASVPVTPPREFDDGATALRHDGHVYEYFDFVEGGRYRRTPEHARAGGEAIGRLLRAASRLRPQGDAVHGTFHASGIMLGAAALAPESILRAEPEADRVEIEREGAAVRRLYRDAAQRAMTSGFAASFVQPIHGDYHPGNLLFDGPRVAAVVDFDAARIEPRAAEVANALLQFASQRVAGAEVSTWPHGLDPTLVAGFLSGLAESGLRLETKERSAIPWLMIEACIAEGIVPIAQTGAFADLRGSEMLGYILRRAEWLRSASDRLLEALCA